MTSSLIVFTVLLLLREGWGWLRSGLSLSWCAVYRIARRCPTPQLQLLTFAGWITVYMNLKVIHIHYARSKLKKRINENPALLKAEKMVL